MNLIKTTETEDELVIERTTDQIKDKFENYFFVKEDEKLKLTQYQDDSGSNYYPPKIDDKIKEEIEKRTEKEIIIAPIFGLKCKKCGHITSGEVEADKNDYGNLESVNDVTEKECIMCDEKRKMKIYKNGLVQEGHY